MDITGGTQNDVSLFIWDLHQKQQ